MHFTSTSFPFSEEKAKIDPELLREEKQKLADLRRQEREKARAERKKRPIDADPDVHEIMGIGGFGTEKKK